MADDKVFRISVGLNTDTAIKDAQKLGQDVQSTLNRMDMGKLDSKTLSFIKNLTSAYSRMVKLRDEAEKLAATKVPTEDYAFMAKELEKSEKALEKAKIKQDELKTSGETVGSRWNKVTSDVENYTKAVDAARQEMQDMEKAEEAFISGTDTQAYKDKVSALNLQNQAVNILVERFNELNEVNTQNIDTTKQETEAVKEETEAVKDLTQAEEYRQRRGISRGPKITGFQWGSSGSYGNRRGISRGPAISSVEDIKFLSRGEVVSSISRVAEAENERAQATQNASEATRNATAITRTYGKTLGSVGKTIISSLKNAINRLVGAFKSLSKHLHSSNKGHNSLGKSLKGNLSTILRYTLGIRSLYMLIRKLRGYVTEAFKVMAQEIPEVNQAISTLGTSFKQLKASLGTMFQPILQAITPLLNALIQRITDLMNKIARFFATLSGQNYIYEATVANYDYADSVKEAEKANEGALASFDKLNVIAKNSADSSNTLGLTKDTVTYKKVDINPEDSWYTRLAKKIAEGWKKADLSEATNYIAEKLANLLDSIDWESIHSKTTKFSKTIATGINGITLPDEKTGKSNLADSIGRTIAEALQTAIDTFDTFITTIDWSNLGKFISTAIEALKNKLRDNDSWKKAGMAFGHLFQGLVKLGLELLVNNNIFEGLGTDISTFINSLIDEGMKVNPNTGNTFIRDFGIALSEGFVNLLKEIEAFLDGSSDELAEAVNELFQGIDLLEIAKHMAIVFLKGLKAGLKLLLSAGLGALGITVDGDTAEFLAEALGIGLLGAKIAKLVGGITGSGGLLSAFNKKDRALDNQKKKLGLETAAVGVLSIALGMLGLKAIEGSDALEGLTGRAGALQGATLAATTAVENLSNSLEGVAETGKAACESLQTETATSLKEVEQSFTMFTPILNEVNTQSYNNVIAVTQQTISTLEEMWANANLTANVKTPTSKTPTSDSSTVTKGAPYSKLVSESVEATSKMKNTSTETSTSTVAQAAPYASLISQSAETTKSIAAKNNAADFAKFLKSGPLKVNGIAVDREEDAEVLFGIFSKLAREAGYNDYSDVFSDTAAYQKLREQADPWYNAEYQKYLDSKYEYGFGTYLKELFGVSNASASLEKGLQNLLKWLPLAGTAASGLPIPYLAQGAVIPANRPFMAVLGDQKAGTNIEAPLSTIEKAVSNVLSGITLKAVFDVKGDPHGIFKVVQEETKIYYNQYGRDAFGSQY